MIILSIFITVEQFIIMVGCKFCSYSNELKETVDSNKPVLSLDGCMKLISQCVAGAFDIPRIIQQEVIA